jgi:site-specific DNA-methyltransferase (adenine-specific)
MTKEIAAVYVHPETLKPWEQNPRDNDEAVGKVAKSIERFGFASPIIARRADGRIIAGHTRLRAALQLGLDEVPVRFMDLDDQSASALALADNRIGEVATWNGDGLSEILADLEANAVDLDALGWSPDELADLLTPTFEPDGSEDDVPEMQAEVHSQPGEVYELGPHRLVCGDCTDPKVWDAVMQGDSADVVLTDPPYGLGDVETTKNDYATYEDTRENLIKLAAAWLPIARDRSPVVVFTPGNAGARAYPDPIWTMAWFTPAGAGSGPWGFCCWQPILCYGADPSLSSGNGRRPDAIVHTESSADVDHPCPKPTNLWIWMVERLTFKRSEIIFDPFGGSGTTMIACASTGRVARLIELDPRYCDVIRRRWTAWADKHGQDPGSGALSAVEE